MGRVVVHRAAVEAFQDDAAAKILERAGKLIADRAADLAPKATGRAAASIHHEVNLEGSTPVAHISWEPAFFYLKFHELGTSKMPARPFLRPALLSRYDL